jgi:hypothetical protein
VTKYHYPFPRSISLLFPALLAATAVSLLPGCKDKEEIKVYRVSKAELESPIPANAPAQNLPPTGMPDMGPMAAAGAPAGQGPMAAMGGMGASMGQPAQVASKAPANWAPQPLSSMRQASYLVKGDKGATVDISLVILDGPAGGLLENVNRWLSQLGQPGIDDTKLAQIGQHVPSSLGDITVVDLEGLPPGGDPTKDGRIVGGIATAAGRTVFFKMHGNAALAESQKTAFIQWIGSVQMADNSSAAPNAATAAPQEAPSMTAPAPEADSAKAQVKWEVPDGWKSVPPAMMRYASFEADVSSAGKAEISVVTLPGQAGGDLQNVNRWRGQIGVTPVSDSDLKSLVTPLKAKDSEFQTVDMAGPTERIVAGWTLIDGNSWFFKLSGPDALVTAEKAKFTKFLGSVQFHP